MKIILIPETDAEKQTLNCDTHIEYEDIPEWFVHIKYLNQGILPTEFHTHRGNAGFLRRTCREFLDRFEKICREDEENAKTNVPDKPVGVPTN